MPNRTDSAACTCQPKGGLPHGEHPYDYGYDDPADCPVHGGSAATRRFDWPEQTFAEEVARSQDGDTILFRVSVPLADTMDWSAPCRFRFIRREDGTFDMVMTDA